MSKLSSDNMMPFLIILKSVTDCAFAPYIMCSHSHCKVENIQSVLGLSGQIDGY
jgi:hypothetical protein